MAVNMNFARLVAGLVPRYEDVGHGEEHQGVHLALAVGVLS